MRKDDSFKLQRFLKMMKATILVKSTRKKTPFNDRSLDFRLISHNNKSTSIKHQIYPLNYNFSSKFPQN